MSNTVVIKNGKSLRKFKTNGVNIKAGHLIGSGVVKKARTAALLCCAEREDT